MKYGWTYHSGYKWWEFSRGTGKFAVQQGRDKKWYVMKVPWIGNPEVFSSHDTKEAGMKAVEDKYA